MFMYRDCQDKYMQFDKELFENFHYEFDEKFDDFSWKTYVVIKESNFNKMHEHFYNCSDKEDDGKTILDIYLMLTDGNPSLNQEVIYKGFRFKSAGFSEETHIFLVKLLDEN